VPDTWEATAIEKTGRNDAVADTPHETALLHAGILQNAIMRSAGFAIMATDANGIIQLFNAGAEQLLGYAAHDVINKLTPSDILDPQKVTIRTVGLSANCEITVAPGIGALVYKASREIEDRHELDYIRKDGSRFPAEVWITALRNDQAEIIGYLLIGTDNTAAHLAAMERERIVRLKDEFVATVSHELRTPLTSIVATLGLLTSSAAGKLLAQAPRLLTIAYTNSQRLVRLVNDILDIEKLESGKAAFDFKRVELESLIEQTIEENRALAAATDVRIRLVPASAAVNVRADRDRLAQVVTNLLSNAIKFSPPGQDVVVSIEAGSESAAISVRDHGHGISEEFKPRIFQKFAQADTTDTRPKSGTGLGLNIVKQIVDRLGGDVGFEDAPGGGTIFRVELPCWTHAVRTRARAPGKSVLGVLLCEDDPEAAIVIGDRLRAEGFETDIAFTADEAVARVAAASYGAILVDLQHPDGDGISLIKRLRAQPQVYNTLLVVLSADLKQAHDVDKPSTLLDILDWLDSPIDVDSLVRVLDREIVRNRSPSLRILHLDSRQDALRAVAKALDATAEVMSVDSIDEARRALATRRFDVAVLDVVLALGSGFELLHELRDGEGGSIPLVVFSPHAENPVFSAQFRAALIRSRTSIDNLVATLRKRLVSSLPAPKDKDAASSPSRSMR
jgi:signal transduction histidine kinase/DNA-binding response OmpR family regulator